MAQKPPDQNFFHRRPHPHPHSHSQISTNQHSHSHTHPHSHIQVPPQFRNPFGLLFDERSAAINYNYIRPYIPSHPQKSDDSPDSLVMRRPRRTRTTFTSTQIAELEQYFLQGRYLTSARLAELSTKLALGTAQVKIWFKNRRRRHKIQSDQQREQMISVDSEQLPPANHPPVKSELQNRGRATGTTATATITGPSNMQSLSLSSSGGSTPTTLTPSPTPSTPTANAVEQYTDMTTFNSFYYSNYHHPHHRNVHPSSRPPTSAPPPLPPTTVALHENRTMGTAHPHAQYPSISTSTSVATAAAQFFARPPTAVAAVSGQNQQHHLQHHPQYHSYQHESYESYQHQKALDSADDADVVIMKEDPDFNFNNPYFMRVTALETGVTHVSNSMTSNKINETRSVGEAPPTAMSPNSEVFEPLTSTNDECPSLHTTDNRNTNVNVNGSIRASHNNIVTNGVEISGELMKSNLKELQVLGANSVSCNDHVYRNVNSHMAFVNGGPAANIMEDCSGAFSKYSRLASETNYHCTIDTFMNAYNNHRNTPGSTQFAYCFN